MQCQEKCRSCQRLNHCHIRVKEWVKCIETIMDKPRENGEGERMAEEVVSFMEDEFYGGINAK